MNEDSKHTPKYRAVIVKTKDNQAIPEGEPFFILRAQDLLAPSTLRYYAKLLAESNPRSSGRVVQHILEHADEFEAWPNRKMPD